ncbi:hypothetical protein [Marinobacter salexigens]|uniref:Uncharacterized protein n=1 Tax=Marinobacter salexigens TaxID=1925763 RepID=A0ABS6A423_9GAMM|nr:hypothetical protein [Marinobacter salexigens]MBU2872425.1 hypothetical protein [Marinobacter salexigens]
MGKTHPRGHGSGDGNRTQIAPGDPAFMNQLVLLFMHQMHVVQGQGGALTLIVACAELMHVQVQPGLGVGLCGGVGYKVRTRLPVRCHD